MAFIEAKEINIRGLLSNAQEAYKVPLYQRPYAWNREQWEDLFDDVIQLGKDDSHFLGSIVVVPETSHRLGVNYFQTVDGQQRLATILIWLAVLRDVAREEGIRGLSDHINDTFLFAKDWHEGVELKIPKLQLGRLDNEAFSSILNSTSRGGYSPLVFECYDFFKERIRKDDIERIRQKLLNQVSIVHINAFNYFNAFRLFETLNDRGLELSAADLIKNFLLMKVSGREEVFNKMISEWNEMYEKVRDKEPVKFIRRYTLSSFKGKISERRLYEGIRERIERENWNYEKILKFTKDVNKKATLYKKIYEASFSSLELNKMLQELQLVEVAPSYTLLLKVLSLNDEGKLSDDDILQIMKLIEIFHIRWGICGQSTSRLDTVYNQICNDLYSLSRSNDILASIKSVFNKEIKNNVDDEIFRRNFNSRTLKSYESRTKYILWKLSKPTGETTINVKEVQTEHIMPQTLSGDWIDYLKDKNSKSEREILALHQENLHKIGNLTIIKGEWNISMSNRLFEDKKKDYEKSEFLITNDLKNYDKWTFEEIQRRCEKLARLAVEIWKWRK